MENAMSLLGSQFNKKPVRPLYVLKKKSVTTLRLINNISNMAYVFI
ncbi:unnamed protein product [Brassica rapa subsp. narinosa]